MDYRYEKVPASYEGPRLDLPVTVQGDVVLKFWLRDESGFPNYVVLGEDGHAYFRTEWSPNDGGEIYFQYLDTKTGTYEAFSTAKFEIPAGSMSMKSSDFASEFYAWSEKNDSLEVSAIFFERSIRGLTKLSQLAHRDRPPVATLNTSTVPYHLTLTPMAKTNGFLQDCIMRAPFTLQKFLGCTFEFKRTNVDRKYNILGTDRRILFEANWDEVRGLSLRHKEGTVLKVEDPRSSSWCTSRYHRNYQANWDKWLRVGEDAYLWECMPSKCGFKVSATFFEHSSCDLTKLLQLSFCGLELASWNIMGSPLLQVNQVCINRGLLNDCILSAYFILIHYV